MVQSNRPGPCLPVSSTRRAISVAMESVLCCWSMSSGGGEVSRSGVVGVGEGVILSCLWCVAW